MHATKVHPSEPPPTPPTPRTPRGVWSLRLVRRFRAEGSSWFAAFRWGWLLCFAAPDARLRPLVAAFSRSWRGADVRPSPLSASSQTPPFVRSRRQTRSALQPLSAAPLPWLRAVLAPFGGPCIARRRWAAHREATGLPPPYWRCRARRALRVGW